MELGIWRYLKKVSCERMRRSAGRFDDLDVSPAIAGLCLRTGTDKGRPWLSRMTRASPRRVLLSNERRTCPTKSSRRSFGDIRVRPFIQEQHARVDASQRNHQSSLLFLSTVLVALS